MSPLVPVVLLFLYPRTSFQVTSSKDLIIWLRNRWGQYISNLFFRVGSPASVHCLECVPRLFQYYYCGNLHKCYWKTLFWLLLRVTLLIYGAVLMKTFPGRKFELFSKQLSSCLTLLVLYFRRFVSKYKKIHTSE